jgi:hypothetical protein
MSRRHLPTFLKGRHKVNPTFAPVTNDPHANLMEERLPLRDEIVGYLSFLKICGQRSLGQMTGWSNDMQPEKLQADAVKGGKRRNTLHNHENARVVETH